MGMSSALWTGANGLVTYQEAIDSLSNNVSNINTVGYKKLDTTFSDLLYTSVAAASTENGEYGTTNPGNIGNGVTVASQTHNFQQGPLNSTGGALDFAIEGEGFFVLNDGAGGEYLTRAGDFYLGATADSAVCDLLQGDGYSVKGFVATSGELSPEMTDITLPTIGTVVEGRVSSTVEVSGNLNSGTQVVAGNTVKAEYGWVDAAGRTVSGLNVGGVQTSLALYSVSSPTTAVNGNTLLTDLAFQTTSTTTEQLFRNIPAGSTVNSRELTVRFEKNGTYYEKTMTVNENTTVADFSTWLCGALGDTSAAGRGNGGVMGTINTPAYDSFAVAGEQAGGFLSYSDAGTQFNIACNVGKTNFISDISLTVSTSITTAEGKKQNLTDKFSTLFSENKHFSDGLQADNPGAVYKKTVARTSLTDMRNEMQGISFVKVATDSGGSTWRWYVNDKANTDAAVGSVNQGTGIVRFDTTGKMVYSNVESGSGLAFDFGALTQMGTSDSISAVTDGYLQGYLQSYTNGDNGTIFGVYDNGYSFVLAQLGMATVSNTAGLTGWDGTLFSANDYSGAAIYNTPGEPPFYFGNIQGGYLEASNYELGADSIIVQRAYQMSSRLVTVANEMLETAVGLKS